VVRMLLDVDVHRWSGRGGVRKGLSAEMEGLSVGMVEMSPLKCVA